MIEWATISVIPRATNRGQRSNLHDHPVWLAAISWDSDHSRQTGRELHQSPLTAFCFSSGNYQQLAITGSDGVSQFLHVGSWASQQPLQWLLHTLQTEINAQHFSSGHTLARASFTRLIGQRSPQAEDNSFNAAASWSAQQSAPAFPSHSLPVSF